MLKNVLQHGQPEFTAVINPACQEWNLQSQL
jgi:hypothetical protein